ncbi:phage holin family protein [Enterococcus sp. DIV0876]|uniref:phage holin family protein n=1 Tax=Enterococcus sp. DIV0876 TaxID=2774633 RepID=UPI003D2FE8CF
MLSFNALLTLLQEEKILYLLSLLCTAMILDFISGCLAAFMTGTLTSSQGINGILRKVASIVLLLFFIPISFLIPIQSGTALLYVLYSGYLWMELLSIFENYQRMGIDVSFFRELLQKIKKTFKADQ